MAAYNIIKHILYNNLFIVWHLIMWSQILQTHCADIENILSRHHMLQQHRINNIWCLLGLKCQLKVIASQTHINLTNSSNQLCITLKDWRLLKKTSYYLVIVISSLFNNYAIFSFPHCLKYCINTSETSNGVQ